MTVSERAVGNVTIQNNIVVNNAIDVDYVEKQTKQQVKPVVVKETDDPKKAGKGGAQAVAVFTGEVKEEKNVKPPKVKKIDEVKQEKAKLEEQAPAVEGGKKKKKLQTEEQMTAPGEAQPQQGEEQPVPSVRQAAVTVELDNDDHPGPPVLPERPVAGEQRGDPARLVLRHRGRARGLGRRRLHGPRMMARRHPRAVEPRRGRSDRLAHHGGRRGPARRPREAFR